MSDANKKLLRSLIEVYTGNYPASIGAAWISDIDKNDFNKIYFGFWGAPAKN